MNRIAGDATSTFDPVTIRLVLRYGRHSLYGHLPFPFHKRDKIGLPSPHRHRLVIESQPPRTGPEHLRSGR